MKITIVQGNDWAGFYLDGVLISQNHSIRYDILIEKLIESGKVLTESENFYIEDQEWLEEQGSLPKLLIDIPDRFKSK